MAAPIERIVARWWAEHALDLGLSPTTLAVLLAILTRINSDGIAWPGRERIMREAGIRDKAAFYRAIKAARAAGLLVVKRRGRQMTNVYAQGPALSGQGDVLESRTSEQGDVRDNRTGDVRDNRTGDVRDNRTGDVRDNRTGDVRDNRTQTEQGERDKINGTRGTPTAAPVSMSWILDLWNETAAGTGLPTIETLTKSRKAAIKSRLSEHSEDDLRAVLEAPRKSKFLRGEAGGRKWSASFDWLIKASNFVKVLDGNYSDKPIRGPGSLASSAGSHDGAIQSFDPEDVRTFSDHPRWDSYCDFVLALPPGEASRFTEWRGFENKATPKDGAETIEPQPDHGKKGTNDALRI